MKRDNELTEFILGIVFLAVGLFMLSKRVIVSSGFSIFTIGNFATKILSFLIVPLYTYILSTDDYGRIDLFFTAGSLVVSFFTLQIHQAMMRFLLGKRPGMKSH